ncbi:MAG: Gfo/Idh/MocA family oxidoreductase [Fuerstiella sp.]|nr:Gfo/Idh/MocA family oxidoreductase [Fuerstiella sp.]MCP4856838.1 Gfo/Idh/MocA family oxidoreductase [Fuerstiella sp.]
MIDHPSRRQFLTTSAVTTASLFAVAGTSTSARAATRSGGRIGFVDNNLDNFHSRTYLRILREDLKQQGFTVNGAFALEAELSRKWAADNDVPFSENVEDLAGKVDCFAILAPSSPELHLQLCEMVLPFGKPVFVDKTFAPNAATATKIFALADRHNAVVQTSSALRYTAVQDHVNDIGRENVKHMVTWGGGSSFEEYIVHPLELAISCLGPDVVEVMRRGTEPQSQLLLNLTNGRTAVVNLYSNARTPYAATVTSDKDTKYISVDTKDLFVRATRGLIDFYKSEEPKIARRETMAIMQVIDASRDPKALERFVKV